MRGLFDRGLTGENIRQLFRFIDWMIDLPQALERPFWEEVHQIEQEKRMPFITSVERIGMEKGREQGRVEGRRDELLAAIEDLLGAKFSAEGLALLPPIKQLADLEAMRSILAPSERRQPWRT